MTDSDNKAQETITRLANSKVIQVLGVVAAFIAVPAFIISLPPVQNRFFDSRPSAEIDLTSQIPIFDVKQPLPNLNVIFNGTDLTASKRSLISVRIRIANVGNRSLTPSDVSSSDPLGFTVDGGQILRLTRSAASSDHLRRFAKPALINNNKIVLNNDIIFDSQDYVEIELLIIKKNDAILTYHSSGKIAKQNTILFVDKRSNSSESGFLQKTFTGNAIIQIARSASYGIIFILTIAFGAFLTSVASEMLLKRRKRLVISVAQEAYEHLSGHNPIAQAFAIGLFSAVGYAPTRSLFRIIQRDYEINDELTAFRDTSDGDGLYDEIVRAKPSEIRKHLSKRYSVSIFSVMQLSRGFRLSNYKSVSRELFSSLEDLLSFLDNKERIKKLQILDSFDRDRFNEEKYFSEKKGREDMAKKRVHMSGEDGN